MLLAAQDPMPDNRCADIRQLEALGMTKPTDPLVGHAAFEWG